MQTNAVKQDDAPAARETVVSHLLGELDVPAEAVYTFPEGVYAFSDRRRFALVPTEHSALYWLQSLEEHALTFLVADPFRFFPGYEAELSDADQAHLGSPAAAEALVLAIVTLPPDPASSATANLRAPVVLNTARRVGRQIMLAQDRLRVAEPLTLG
jgi:flagellar assembly factor FliW